MGTLELVLGEEDIRNPLEIAAPLGLASSTEMDRGIKVLSFDDTMAISNWVKYGIPSFSKLVGLPVSQYEKLCIALLERLEYEIEAANLLHREDTVHRKSVKSTGKWKRELSNLISSVNYDGR